MSYAELLSKIIRDSGLSLREISDRCEKKGQQIAPSYISKLQTGKQPPGSEEVTRTLADVCGGDAELLIWEGYLEKAPQIIRKYINISLPHLKHSLKTALPIVLPKDEAEVLVNLIDQLSPPKFSELIGSIDIQEIQRNKINVDKNLNVYINHKNTNINIAENLGITLYDESMLPLIPPKSIVKLIPKTESLQDGSIIAFSYKDQIYIRKLYIHGDYFVLVPENTSFSPILVEKAEIEILGIVKYINFTL